jgi:aspartate racemase
MSQEVKAGQKRKIREAALPRGLQPVAPYSRTTKFAHLLFEEQAARAPHHVATVCRGRKLSYGELDARANQLAFHLRSRGVGPDTLVAICVERSLEMVVGILGVLKAGGAYLPLDPAYPQERLEFMIADSEPAILLTQSHLAADLPRCQGPTFLLDALNYATRGGRTEKQGPKYRATDLAYVIYTSGSTEKPKGAMITQGNLSHHALSMQRATGITESDVYLHTAAISISASVRQLMLPLSMGATIVIATTEDISDPIALFRTIKQLGVTVIDIVPSYWRSCVAALKGLPPALCGDLLANKLGLILLGGEPLLSDLPRAWRFQLNHKAKLINMFGQKETAGIVSTFPIVPRDENKVGMVPIGKPINNVPIYLLDSQLQPVEFGESGEIFVGGPTVGRGYLNDPALSAARFSRDPFATGSDAGLYRTGDLGRVCADGTLEFQGHIEPSPASETAPGPDAGLLDEQG